MRSGLRLHPHGHKNYLLFITSEQMIMSKKQKQESSRKTEFFYKESLNIISCFIVLCNDVFWGKVSSVSVDFFWVDDYQKLSCD